MHRNFQSVREEFLSPVSLNFFSGFSLCPVLLGTAFLELSPAVSRCFWIIGVALQLIVTVTILSIWIRPNGFQIEHFNPAWFIPILGNFAVPLAGVVYSKEISWFFYSIGIIFWILLFTIFLYRIIFVSPLPSKLLPTLFIILVPPALAFSSYVRLSGIDNFAKVLYYFAMFIFILLIAQIRTFIKVKFSYAWWAYSFPMASITIATSIFYNQTGFALYKPVFFFLLLLLTALILLLITYTLKSIIKGCTE